MLGGFELALWLLLTIASITDLIWGKVYNWTTFAFFLAGLICRFHFEGPAAGFQSLQAVGLALFLFLPLYILDVVAAGDVKLLMAFAAWTQPPLVLRLSILAVIVGGFVGLISLLQSRGVSASAASVWKHAKGKASESDSFRMAFAPAFFIAFLILQVGIYRHWEFAF